MALMLLVSGLFIQRFIAMVTLDMARMIVSSHYLDGIHIGGDRSVTGDILLL